MHHRGSDFPSRLSCTPKSLLVSILLRDDSRQGTERIFYSLSLADPSYHISFFFFPKFPLPCLSL